MMMSRISALRGCRSLLCNNVELWRMTTGRRMHLATGAKCASLRQSFQLNTYKHSRLAGSFFIRHASTNDTPEAPILPPIPDVPNAVEQTKDVVAPILSKIPEVPQAVEKAGEVIMYHANGEPTLASLGLGGFSPTGLVQSSLEWIHITFDLPWFAAIAAGTMVLRLLLFPLMIKSQRNMAHMSRIMPRLTQIQEDISNARRQGDYGKILEATAEMDRLYKTPSFRPFQSLLLPFVQMPVFISVFLALRDMANLPVESLKQGGIWWFTDLTVPDPYYVLPIVTSVTVFITFKLTTDLSMQQHSLMRFMPVFFPIIVFPFMIGFPAALPCYWTTTNFFTLIQASILRTNAAQTYFNIPKKYEAPQAAAQKKKSIITSFKDSIDNIKFSKRVNDKLHADKIKFDNAGTGPVPTTYAYDPTKPRSNTTRMLSKSKR